MAGTPGVCELRRSRALAMMAAEMYGPRMGSLEASNLRRLFRSAKEGLFFCGLPRLLVRCVT